MPVFYLLIGVSAGLVAALAWMVQGNGPLSGLLVYSAFGQIAVMSLAFRQARAAHLHED